MLDEKQKEELRRKIAKERLILLTVVFVGLVFVIGGTLFYIYADVQTDAVDEKEIITNDRGTFYKLTDGVRGVMSSKAYDGFYELMPIESDDICTFGHIADYTKCIDIFGEEGLEKESVIACNEHHYNGIRISDEQCVSIYTFGWVDDFNRAVNEHEYSYFDWENEKRIKTTDHNALIISEPKDVTVLITHEDDYTYTECKGMLIEKCTTTYNEVGHGESIKIDWGITNQTYIEVAQMLIEIEGIESFGKQFDVAESMFTHPKSDCRSDRYMLSEMTYQEKDGKSIFSIDPNFTIDCDTHEHDVTLFLPDIGQYGNDNFNPMDFSITFKIVTFNPVTKEYVTKSDTVDVRYEMSEHSKGYSVKPSMDDLLLQKQELQMISNCIDDPNCFYIPYSTLPMNDIDDSFCTELLIYMTDGTFCRIDPDNKKTPLYKETMSGGANDKGYVEKNGVRVLDK